MDVMMFYEDSICIMMQQPTITTISRWPIGALPLLYSPGTCTHCRRPLLLPVSSTAATISPPTLLSHIDLWIMKVRQLGRIACLVGGYSTHVKHHACQQVHLPQFLGVCIYIYIHIQYKKWVIKKELHVKNAQIRRSSCRSFEKKSLRTFPSMKNSDFPRWIQKKIIPFVLMRFVQKNNVQLQWLGVPLSKITTPPKKKVVASVRWKIGSLPRSPSIFRV